MASLFRRSNGIYYLVTTSGSRKVWKSTGTRNKQEALEYLIQHGTGTHPKPLRSQSISQFTAQFIELNQKNYSPNTIALYRQASTAFQRMVGDRHLSEVGVVDIEAFKVGRSKEVSDVKVNIDLRTLKALFQTAVRYSLLPKNPFTAVKQIKIPPRPPVYLSKADFEILMSVIKDRDFQAIVCFAVCTMMRIGEILSLRWDAVDLNRRMIYIRNSESFTIKSGKPRVVPMNDWVAGHLATCARRSSFVFTGIGGKKLLVPSTSHRFKKYIRLAGLPEHLHFHSLRHTGATWLIQNGASIYEVQKLLGHSDIKITQVYSHLEGENLHSTVDKIVFIKLRSEEPTTI